MLPGAVRIPPIQLHRRTVLGHQKVIAQRRKRAVGDQLLAPVGQFSRRRQHLGDQAGCGLVERLAVGGLAGQQHVRVVEGRVLLKADLHVADEHRTGRPAGGGPQMEEQIAGDAVVGLAGTGHRVDLAGDIFVANVAQLFAGEIVGDIDRWGLVDLPGG